jgi:deazaflavin-dependent oxidoreductase (nitroreductase family)
MEPDDQLTRDRLGELLAELRSEGGPGGTTRAFNEALIAEFRRTGGVIAGELGGPEFRFLLLTATGAKSGRPRTVPLGYVKVGGRLVILASKGGSPTDPLWFRNVVAHPDVTVELGTDTFAARAVVLEGEERDRVFAAIVAKAPMFGQYQERTPRPIPVVELQRVDQDDPPTAERS